MKKILGMLIILIVIMVTTALINPNFLSAYNLSLVLIRSSLFAIIGIGVAYVIITGGIDLSIGALIALVGSVLCMLLRVELTPPEYYPESEVSLEEKAIIVNAESSEFKDGDMVIFRNGLVYVTPTAFEVGGVEEDGTKLLLDDAFLNQAFTVELPFAGDPSGELLKVHPIARFGHSEIGEGEGEGQNGDAERKRRLIYVQGDYSWLDYDDKLSIFSGKKFKEGSHLVTSAEFDGTETVIEVRNPIDDADLSAEFFVPFKNEHMSVPLAILIALLIGVGAGLIHGFLVTKIGLQPFVVTLCGFLIYRGVARTITSDKIQDLGVYYQNVKEIGKGNPVDLPVPGLEHLQYSLMKHLPWHSMSDEEIIKQAPNLALNNDPETGEVGLEFFASIPIGAPVLIMLVIAVLAIVLLRFTVFGRYLMALGNNEKAARYSGINTHRLIILAYVISASLAGIMGVIYVLKFGGMQPNSGGSLYELYAIAAAVLGGCSLRGGTGTIVGVIIGAAVMQVLYNAIGLAKWPTQMELMIIGGVLLISVTFDELVRKIAAKRRAAASTSGAGPPASG